MKIECDESSGVNINGVDYVGNNSISIKNGVITIDGKVQTGSTITHKVEVFITGPVAKVETMSGDVTVTGSVNKVTTMSGDVKADLITGTVETMSGDIKYVKK